MRSNEQFLRELLKLNKMHAMRYWVRWSELHWGGGDADDAVDVMVDVYVHIH